MSNKKEYGQFYTTNFDYILKNIDCKGFKDEDIIEPFVGGADLIKWMKTQDVDISKVQIYDIEPNESINEVFPKLDLSTIQRNTLKNPPNYKNKYPLTNPPYLAKNKCKGGINKELFKEYNISDLFRIHIHQITEGDCAGGIQIIPLNFISSIQKKDIKIRDAFLKKYRITQLNIFEEKVFDDTTCTICSFKFVRSEIELTEQSIPTTFFPSKEDKICLLSKENDWLFGGEIYKKQKYNYKVDRLTLKNKDTCENNGYVLTQIKLIGLDSGSLDNKIRLELNEELFYGKNTDRAFATMIIKPNDEKKKEILANIENQKEIIKNFNSNLNQMREKYNSLFLSNFREAKNGNGRKRMGFKLCYKLINDLLIDY